MLMVSSSLVLHTGGKLVTLDELRDYRAPPPEGRWHPISHDTVLDTVKEILGESGYEVRSEKLALNAKGTRFFGTLDLAMPIATGVSLAVGVRNSTDKSFPLGFCGGSRVFVCDNLAFRADLLVKRKHTVNGARNFQAAIAQAVISLGEFKEMESVRIKGMMQRELSTDRADSLILRSYEKGIISALQLPLVLKEWREPSFEEFTPRTTWSLFNAFTSVLRERATSQPARYAVQTIRLSAMLEPSSSATDSEVMTVGLA
jgi:Domain of unknown function (DUF932)